MKRIKYFFILVSFMITVFACHKKTVGYLITEYAGYEIDSLVVRTQLDDTEPTEIPNPRYDMLIGFGLSPEQIIDMGIFPTIKVGGGEDYDRVRLNIPWTSTALEGIDGTLPISASIKDIKTDIGSREKIFQYLTVRGNGVFSIPLNHDIPPGRYIISLTFRNEGYSRSLDDIFTIIVE